jgi:hypothetical protein
MITVRGPNGRATCFSQTINRGHRRPKSAVRDRVSISRTARPAEFCKLYELYERKGMFYECFNNNVGVVVMAESGIGWMGIIVLRRLTRCSSSSFALATEVTSKHDAW